MKQILILIPLIATIFLVINPSEQMAKKRDEEKISILKMLAEEREIETPSYVFRDTNGESKIIYARLESRANNSVCTSLDFPKAYAVYSVHEERKGIVCTEPEKEPIAVNKIFFTK